MFFKIVEIHHSLSTFLNTRRIFYFHYDILALFSCFHSKGSFKMSRTVNFKPVLDVNGGFFPFFIAIVVK